MGSSASGAADCGVGSIVWVRRRNGSWWPGKILGAEELSASHVMSPRSGTPVKLLGREDASVDWYNLEKSKRVKAFRCGEFDDCIERAESTHGLPIKKREKYARREDAILHALELEKQMLKRQGLLGVTSERKCSKSSVSLEKEPVTSSGSFGNDNAKFGNQKSQQYSNKLDTVRKDDIIASPLYLQKVKEESQLSQEDDISEATPRMRGLLELGPRITPSKRNLPSSVSTYGYEKDAFDHTSQALLTHDTIMGSTSQVNGKKSLDKKKRSNEGLSEDISVKRRDKSRPLVQVLQNSAKLELFDSLLPDYGTNPTSVSGAEQMVAVSRAEQSKYVYLPTNSSDSVDYKDLPSSLIEMPSSRVGEGDRRPQLGSFLEESASGFMDDVHSDSSDTDSSESDSNDDSSETEPDLNREMTVLSESNLYSLGRPRPLEEYGNLSSEELEESAHSGDTAHQLPANNTVPRWKSKGKRNVRNPRRRSMDTLDGKAFDFSKRTSRHNSSIMRNDVYTDGADWNGKDVGGPMVGSGYGGYPSSPRYSLKSPNMTRWADSAREDPNIWGRYWEDPREYFDSLYAGRNRARSFLVEVDVQVQASYQKEPVPFVSLMSKLNGKAIIGHPIQIEKLDDGSTETLIDDFGNEASLYDGDAALPPAWRTARRTTNFRIRRPHLDIDEAAEDLPFSPCKKGSSSRPPVDRKFRKKVSKSGQPSSQKRRRLSSIAGLQDRSKSQMMKQVTTTVACIPVKLVFSRLLEKINRPPSKALSNVVT